MVIKLSPNFLELKRRIKQLEKHLIGKISATGNYTPRRNDLIRGYRLLAHAEIEHYIEEVASNAVKKAFRNWKAGKKSSKVLTALLTHTDLKIAIKQKDKKADYFGLDERINIAVTSYFNSVSQNHGIKEDNLLEILVPIGFEIDEFDQTLLSTMNSFGSNRGLTAHKSAKVAQNIDPHTEINEVKNILSGLEVIDRELIDLSKL
jgi:hypothetical protein